MFYAKITHKYQLDTAGRELLIPIQTTMPRKIRELIRALQDAGFHEIPGGKGSHRKFVHNKVSDSLTIAGNLGEDAKHYQEKMVKRAVKEAEDEKR